MKITIDLSRNLVGLDGQPLEPAQSGGPVLAGVLVNQSRGNVLKFWDWAMQLHAGKPVVVDLADYQTLYKFIEDCDTMTILAKAQMLAMLIAAKDTAQKTP